MRPDDPARRRDRRIGRTHHILLVVPRDLGQILGDRAAGDGEAIAVKEAVVEKGLHEERNAARFEEVLGDIAPAGLEIGDVRGALEDLGDLEKIERDAALMRDRRKMQRRVGGAARGGNHGRRVFERSSS